ncbi:MAG TPA: hypothetical protein VHY91_27670 [Pirellulales bacterium]|nr:hypothetical protein [Pirellulales bacterium]
MLASNLRQGNSTGIRADHESPGEQRKKRRMDRSAPKHGFPLDEPDIPETPPPADQIAGEVEASVERILTARHPMLNLFDLNYRNRVNQES